MFGALRRFGSVFRPRMLSRSMKLKASLAIGLPSFQLLPTFQKLLSTSARNEDESDQFEEETEYSESRDEDPSIPGLIVLVADGIDDVVYKSGKDVIVDVYQDGCPACDAYACTLEQLAYAFEPVKNVVIAKMNGERNFKKGFLTQDQLDIFPTVLMFPADENKAPKSTELKFQFDANKIIEEIYSNRKTAWVEEEKKAVLKRAGDYRPTLLRKRDEFLDKRIDTELLLDERAPCGSEYVALWRNTEMRRFGERTPNDEILDMSFMKWKDCENKNIKQALAYWRRIQSKVGTEIEELEKMEERIKK